MDMKEADKLLLRGKVQGIQHSVTKILELAVSLRERDGLHHDASILSDSAKFLETEITRLKAEYELKYKERLII